MKPAGHRLRPLPGSYAVCRLPPEAPVPAWAGGAFLNLTRTADELSIVCPAAQVPPEIRAERDWRVLKMLGPFPFDAVGVLASVAGPLAAAGISLLALGTYDTDYVLVKSARLADALAVLAAAGHTVDDA